MSYIRAKVAEQEEPPEGIDHGFSLRPVNFRQRTDLDCNLDDEMLSFVLGVIEKIDILAEGEALVIWKEIF